MDVNLRSLRYFLAVAEYGSITRAALHLHITQPSLTQHLKHLEDHFGLALVMRHGRGIVLTEAGLMLRQRAEHLVDQIDGLQSELEYSTPLPRGILSVGMPMSWSELITYPVIARFRELHPNVRIKLVVNSSEALAEAMTGNEIQFGILTEIDDLSQFDSAPLVADALFLVGPASADLEKRMTTTLASLVEYPMILPLNSAVGLGRINRSLAASGLTLKRVIEAPSTHILSLVARGAGYSAISAVALPLADAASPYSAVEIAGMSMTWMIATPRKRPRTAAVAAFESILRAQVASCVASGQWATARLLSPAAHDDVVVDGRRST